MTSNVGTTGNPLAHPLQAVAGAIGNAGADPRPLQKASFFQGANNGPAETAAVISGVKRGGKKEDDGEEFLVYWRIVGKGGNRLIEDRSLFYG